MARNSTSTRGFSAAAAPAAATDGLTPPALAAERLAPPAHAVLRAGAGLLFMQHGAQKLFGMFGGFGGTPGATADLVSLMGVAGVLEFFGGLLIVVGLFARPVAVLLMGLMASAWFMAHAPQGWVPIQNGGELALLFLLVWTYIAAAGAGPFSVDAALGRRRGRSVPAAAAPDADGRIGIRRREVA